MNEGLGISNVIKYAVDDVYQLFINNSYSQHNYKFGNDLLGYRILLLKFNKLNNYYSNIQIDKTNTITVNFGIPTNGKEKRVKENIAHELTHVIEILGLQNKNYPKYNSIKLSLIEFKTYPMSPAMKFITDVFYKTLDNEINANIAQTYIYIKSEGRCTKSEALKKLRDWDTYKLYDNIKNIDLNILERKISNEEVKAFNDILLKNGVTTTKATTKIWLNKWFKIFKKKASTFLQNSKRILTEIENDWNIFENYVNSENSENLDYTTYIKTFEEFKNH